MHTDLIERKALTFLLGLVSTVLLTLSLKAICVVLFLTFSRVKFVSLSLYSTLPASSSYGKFGISSPASSAAVAFSMYSAYSSPNSGSQIICSACSEIMKS